MFKLHEGKKVEHPHEALTTYELCKLFSCLPSQLEHEDAKQMYELIAVHNAYNELEKKETKKQRREALKKKTGGGSR